MYSKLLSERPCNLQEGRVLLQLADILVAQWRARAQANAASNAPLASAAKTGTPTTPQYADDGTAAKPVIRRP